MTALEAIRTRTTWLGDGDGARRHGRALRAGGDGGKYGGSIGASRVLFTGVSAPAAALTTGRGRGRESGSGR
jgi:hypothetical protein